MSLLNCPASIFVLAMVLITSLQGTDPPLRQGLPAQLSALDRIEPVARAGIPIFGVSGDADEAVAYEANLAELVRRYRAAGGLIEVVIKPGGKHHPHSLADPAPIVDFLLRHARN